MINKRLLIKNLLAHNSENSFYDKKRSINLSLKEGKAKFLKHVCALANSNPANNSYMVIGVEDEDNRILGVDFFDDSRIQNLINAYLEHPPLVSYENIPFPQLPEDKVVGLVTVRSREEATCSFRKGIWKYPSGSTFFREGSISLPTEFGHGVINDNREVVAAIEVHSHNNIGLTLDGVFEFFRSHADLGPGYKVFKEYFVVCWSGKRKQVKGRTYFSRVDIELINEQVKLFYSELDEVSIHLTDSSFSITEFVRLGLNDRFRYYPMEEVDIFFGDNATYDIRTKMVFEPPEFEKKTLFHIYNANIALLKKLRSGKGLSAQEEKDLQDLPTNFLLCYLNGFSEAVEKLDSAKEGFRDHGGKAYLRYKESLRILRKIKYS